MNAHLDRYLSAESLTQRGFAAQLGVREATVSAWRAGTRPRPEMMERIEKETGGRVPVASWFQSAPASSDEAAG